MTTKTGILAALALAVAIVGHASASTDDTTRVVDGAVDGAMEDAVGAAITRAVRQRMGDTIHVRVTQLRVDVAESGALHAVPDPGARAGRLVRFTLQSGTRRVGDAAARVDLSGPHVRTRQPVARDVPLSAEDIEAVEGDLPSVRFEPLPTVSDAIGQRVRRAIGLGEVITASVVALPEAVRSGDEVRALVRVGAVEAWGTGRAWGSGRIGDVIRVTRGTTHTASRARIVAPGIVEIMQ